jgi:hypothetical protein
MSDKQNKQNKLHFILRAFFYEKTSGGDVPKKWDTSHLKNRSYFVIDYLNCEEHERKGDTSKVGSTSAEDASEKHEFRQLFELSDKEAIQHFTRIVGGDFPWIKLNQLATESHRKGEITKDELLDWQDKHTFNEKHTEVLAKLVGDGKTQYERMTREVLNDILLWGIALDYRWGCEEVNGELILYLLMTKTEN